MPVKEIVCISLENEMDLILAHKHSMRIMELSGNSLPVQTIFATAVSEISRVAIDEGKNAHLCIQVTFPGPGVTRILALVKDETEFITADNNAIRYARRLVDGVYITRRNNTTEVVISYDVTRTDAIRRSTVNEWTETFRSSPPVSPYDEIKRKNIQLLELSEKIKESEKQFRTLTNSLPQMIFTVSVQGDILYVNNWLSEYTGVTADELNATKWNIITHPDDHNIWNTWQSATRFGDSIYIETRLKKSNGTYRWFTGVITPVTNNNIDIVYWIGYLVDIHERKIAEQALKDNEELREAQKKLEQSVAELNRSNEELEKFAYVASHDLQEPLRKISFYSDMLKEKTKTALSPEGMAQIESIIKAADRMKTLINDTLAYSTINTNRTEFSRCDLNIIAADAVTDLEVAIMEKQATVNIGKLPVIQGNRNQLQQLFENIISNSVKYTKPGEKPVVSITAVVKDGLAVIEFKDNGIGFEEKYLDKIFSFFQRLHGRSDYAGTGIGLAICKKIVTNHGGIITAVSEPGAGSTFIVKLPVSKC